MARAVRLDAGLNLDLRAGTGMDIRASAALDLRSATGASLLAPRVTLGCPNGKPAARIGDQVNTSVSPPMIVQGSQTVLVC